MQAVATLLPTLFALALMAAMFKLSARLYRGSRVTWSAAFVYALLLILCITLLGLTRRTAGGEVPLLLSLAAGFALHILLGGWFLGRNVKDKSGAAIGFPHGALVGILGIVLLLASLALPALIVFLVRH